MRCAWAPEKPCPGTNDDTYEMPSGAAPLEDAIGDFAEPPAAPGAGAGAAAATACSTTAIVTALRSSSRAAREAQTTVIIVIAACTIN